MAPLSCRFGLHKWEDYGEVVLIEWKEPGFVPSTTETIRKYVHSQRKCSRCGLAEKRLFADNRDGTKAAIGWEKMAEDAYAPTE